MVEFHRLILEENRDLVDRAKNHPLNDLILQGKLSKEQSHRWFEQGYLLVEDYGRFLAALVARAPRNVRTCMLEYMLNVHMELGLFSEPVGDSGILSEKPRMSFATHAYVSFLQSAAHVRSFGEGLSACYALNVSWAEVRSRLLQTKKSPHAVWDNLAEAWSHDDPSRRIGTIAKCIDRIGEETTDECKRSMHESFRQSICYLLRFWDGIVEGADW